MQNQGSMGFYSNLTYLPWVLFVTRFWRLIHGKQKRLYLYHLPLTVHYLYEKYRKLILIMNWNASESNEQFEQNFLSKQQILVGIGQCVLVYDCIDQILVRIGQCVPVYDCMMQILVRITQCAPEFDLLYEIIGMHL